MENMNTDLKFRGLIKVVFVIVLLAFAYSAMSYVRTYSKSIEPGAYRSFSVSGEGKVVAIPDVAQFTFSVITEGGNDVAKLQADNTTKANSINSFIKSGDVLDKDIKTQNYSVSPRYQYFSCPRVLGLNGEPTACPPPEIVGYTINQSVQIKIRDFDKIGDLLGGVVERGANNVSQLSFAIDDPTEIESEARAEAIEEAKEKAEAIAKAGGFRLGDLLSIQEGGGVVQVYRTAVESYDFGAPSASPAPKIEAGSQDVVVNVTLVYEIR